MSIRPMRWTDREFTFDLPAGWFPAVLERLDGTAARAESMARGVDQAVLSRRPVGGWSFNDHIGHLVDLGDLDRRRLDEFLSGIPVLTAADMTNRRTHEAGHDARPTAELLSELAERRGALVSRLRGLSEAEVLRPALHPRLDRPMRLIDWAYFVAEHDDHHLAHARAVLRGAGLP